MSSLAKKVAIYLAILLAVFAGVAYHILSDFARTPYPPDMRLADYEPRSMLVTAVTPIAAPRFPVIDFHSHVLQSGLTVGQVTGILDQAGVTRVIDLSGKWGRGGEPLQALVDRYRLKAPGRFVVFLHLSVTGMRYGEEAFVQERVTRIERAHRMGCKGIKIGKELGMLARDAAGKLIAVDDPRLDPIWEKIGDLGMIVMIHSGDPPAFWDPFDRHNQRYLELERAEPYIISPQTTADMPPLEDILRARERLVARHPQTVFVGAHLAGQGWDLPDLARQLEAYPNFYVDLSDRLYEIGRQPYSGREFIIDHQDRILFGIDADPELQAYYDSYRCLETFDESMEYPRAERGNVHWRIHGVGLPDDVLRKIYYENAERLLAGVKP